MTTQPLVIIPCGGKKADGPRPARDLYIGSYFRACLATALAVGPADRVRILSAKHGLLSLDAEVAPYELRMDSPIAVPGRIVREQAARADLLDTAHVIVLAGSAYARKAGAIWPRALDALAGTAGIGEQLARLAAWRVDPASLVAMLPPLPTWRYVQHAEEPSRVHAVRAGDALTECGRHVGRPFREVAARRMPSCAACSSAWPSWAREVETARRADALLGSGL